MLFGVPASELAMLALAIMIGGAITGTLAGLFGVGGGGIIVPILYEIFGFLHVPDDVRMQLCVGTSLAIIIPTSIRSFRAHHARGGLPVEILKMWAAPVVAGVVIGGVIAAFAPSEVFKLAFVVIALALGAKLLFLGDRLQISDELPGPAGMTAYGLLIGLYSALMGVGGGGVTVAILRLHGKPIHTAIGISAGIGIIISVVGAIGFMLAGWPHQAELPPLSVGFVSLIGFVLMAPLSSLMAPLGARIAHALPKRKLEIAFGVFLWLVAGRFIVSLF